MIGLGYIGLPTAALIAKGKTRVLGVDINPQVVETVNQGKIHIVEPELDKAVADAVQEGFLKVSNDKSYMDYILPLSRIHRFLFQNCNTHCNVGKHQKCNDALEESFVAESFSSPVSQRRKGGESKVVASRYHSNPSPHTKFTYTHIVSKISFVFISSSP